jgi:hypothetical protein
MSGSSHVGEYHDQPCFSIRFQEHTRNYLQPQSQGQRQQHRHHNRIVRLARMLNRCLWELRVLTDASDRSGSFLPLTYKPTVDNVITSTGPRLRVLQSGPAFRRRDCATILELESARFIDGLDLLPNLFKKWSQGRI